MIDWHDISYLSMGSPVQQRIYAVLIRSGVLEALKNYDAVLAGTYPIGINIAGSDLDIICRFGDPRRFERNVRQLFSSRDEFTINVKDIRGCESVVARFTIAGFRFEIFGQAVPVREQYAYRHMLIEFSILERKGSEFKNEIIRLKEKGFSTEEAFAKLLSIKGDPYEGLLELE